MKVDLSAVPNLLNTDPVPGSGAKRTAVEWAIELDELRPRFMTLSYRELCSGLRKMELGDIVGLVISRPYDAALLDKFLEGLQGAIGKMVAEDCREYGESLLSADLAYGTIQRSEAVLTAIESQRATSEQLEALKPLALQLAGVPDREWYDNHLPTTLLLPLIVLSGGLEGPFGHLPDEDRAIIRQLLGSSAKGNNILLYGKPGVDKTGLAYQLACAAETLPYQLVAAIPEEDLPVAVVVAQRLLAESPGAVLVITQPAAILTRQYPDLAFLFGGGMEHDDEARPFDQRILADNPIPTLWLTTRPRSLHPESVARFLFHAEALKGARADRRATVETALAAMPLPENERNELIRQEGLSVQQLTGAMALAERVTGPEGDPDRFARTVILAVNRSQKALARRDKDEARQSITHYSLDYLHYAGRFGPAQILQALRRQGQGTLCIYGLPGTGKTQFAEYLALELGKPLLIKRASDILDKYLGESEKRLAEMFEQAEEEGAILLLDEADSFLRDRTLSRQSWEVTSVNELLQQMERFEGLFICTTNLYTHLDMAALRRFTFKIEFLPLTLHQRWAMFRNEAVIDEANLCERLRGEYEERLALMRDLTPGDFATVKRQCCLLGESLSPEEWLEQLDIEVAAKRPRSDPTEERA